MTVCKIKVNAITCSTNTKDLRSLNVDNTKKLKHLSLCTGYGGIDLGLSRALKDVRTICYVEVEAFAIKNLVNKIEKGLLDAGPVFTDLKAFPWHIFSGKVDILSGGFPCQPFSTAGRRKASEDPRHLWPYIKKGIKQLDRPPIIFLENVEGIISAKLTGDEWEDPAGTSVLHHVLRELERMGYETEASIFSASEIGAPHQRKRVFILAVRNDFKKTGLEYINNLIKSNQSNRFTAWPASRGQVQYSYEPPRTTTGTQEAKPEMGRDADGATDRVDYAELYKACDNRTDELRMLGNGVVPDTATRAFRVLWRKVGHTYNS